MNWPEAYFRKEAEIILNNFDLTSEEVNLITKEWNEEIDAIPDEWWSHPDTPGDMEPIHALSSLQRIALEHVRQRP